MGIKPLQCTQYKVEAFSPTADNSACCNQLGRGIIAAAPGSTLLRVTCILLGGGGEKVQCVLCWWRKLRFAVRLW